MTRFRFLESLAAVCTGMLGILGLGGAVRALRRPKGYGQRVLAWRVVLQPSDVPEEGGVLKVAFEGQSFLIRLVDDKPLAWNATCTHAGCIVDWAEVEDRFFCACHSSYFDQEGNPLTGPAEQPLRVVEARWGRGDVVELFV